MMETTLAEPPDPPRIKSVRWYHDRIIDYMLESPVPPTQNEIARTIGYTPAWVSIIINSDAFKMRLEERKTELTDPKIIASINERLDGLARSALDRLLERLDTSPGGIKTGDLIAMAKLGVGDKNTRVPQQTSQNLYVVNIPPPAKSSDEWLASTGRDVSDAVPVRTTRSFIE